MVPLCTFSNLGVPRLLRRDERGGGRSSPPGPWKQPSSRLNGWQRQAHLSLVAEWSCSAGSAPPSPWARCPTVVIEHQVLREPAAALATLQQSWSERQPLVVELAVGSKQLQEPEICLRRSTS